MPRIAPMLDRHFQHQIWRAYEKELVGEYAHQRMLHCAPTELLELFFRAPVCEECIPNDPHRWADWPSIMAADWEEHILCELGEDARDDIVRSRALGEPCAFTCFRCGRDIEPWNGDDVYTITEHWEEYHGIATETPNRVNPSPRARDLILSAYDHRCFSCGRADRALPIDHIHPRVLGGDAALRNLQPLCTPCGNLKAATPATTVEVTVLTGFGPASRWEPAELV